MINDLISRSAVLEMIEDLITIHAKTKMHEDIPCVCKSDLVRNISGIPTAYDVDNVVKQLETLKVCHEEKVAEYNERGDIQHMDIWDSFVIAYGKAIEIVKSGGINKQ